MQVASICSHDGRLLSSCLLHRSRMACAQHDSPFQAQLQKPCLGCKMAQRAPCRAECASSDGNSVCCEQLGSSHYVHSFLSERSHQRPADNHLNWSTICVFCSMLHVLQSKLLMLMHTSEDPHSSAWTPHNFQDGRTAQDAELNLQSLFFTKLD